MFKKLNDVNLEPININNYDDFFKEGNMSLQKLINNNILPGFYEESKCVFFNKEKNINYIQFISALKLQEEVYIYELDEDSFERLFYQYYEIKTEVDIKEQVNNKDTEEDFDDFDVSDFLKNNNDITNTEESAPIIKFVNSLFYQAIKRKSSDIHIESHDNKGYIRLRIDGVLQKYLEVEKHILIPVISRIKVISNLDISEKRIPQDGRTNIKIGRKSLDIRISTLPTFYGERIVMRVLMESDSIPELNELGFDKDLETEFLKLLDHSHGVILVTGPTGSGKSTTLHSFLKYLTKPTKNIITVEDPVEYKAKDINQIQTNTKVGLTFASGLRSILRQDPDIIMVGEIRDKETAEIAIQAANTGHLLLSTLHTNTAIGSISRLNDIGVEEFMIHNSLIGVLAQRLIRLLCPHCKEEDNENELFIEEFNINKNNKVYKHKGCKQCNYSGFVGRKAIGEVFLLDKEVKSFLKTHPSEVELLAFLKEKKGMKTLQDKMISLVEDGLTSIEETIRVGIKDEG